jgi:sporulation related protein
MNAKYEIQKEFFKEYAQTPKPKRKSIDISSIKKVYDVRLSNEQLVFAFIGLVVLLLVCFSFGVEKGKRVVIAESPKPSKFVAVSAVVATKTVTKVAVQTPKTTIAKEKPSLYLIQLAAYKDAKKANKEKAYLENSGYAADVVNSGSYSVLYATGFQERKEAEKSLIKLADRYKGCFVRKQK